MEEHCDKGDRLDVGIGVALLAKRAELEHGEFGPWLQRMGIHPRAAQQRMKIAKFYGSLELETAKKLIKVPARKIRALARLPAPIVETMAEAGELDDIEKQNLREVEEIVRLEESQRICIKKSR